MIENKKKGPTMKKTKKQGTMMTAAAANSKTMDNIFGGKAIQIIDAAGNEATTYFFGDEPIVAPAGYRLK